MDPKKALVIVLLITLALSVLGTFKAYSGLKSLTGAWENGTTTRGSVNLTIQQLVSINFTHDRVDFGSGFVPTNSSACYLETNTVNVGCGGGFTSNVQPLSLENQGNVNVKLNLSNLNFSTSLIGGTNPGYAWSWNDPESDSVNATCNQTNFSSAPANANVLASREDGFINISTSGQTYNVSSLLCTIFNASDTNDVINISFKLLVPNDAIAETGKFDTWTATAVAL